MLSRQVDSRSGAAHGSRVAVLEKLLQEAKQGGILGAGRSAARALTDRIVERDRVAVLLRVDLADPGVRLRPKDRALFDEQQLRLLPFDRESLPRVITMLERSEPARIPSAKTRFLQGAAGFVFERRGQVIGYVFWVEGADDPDVFVHTDVEWLGIQPRRREIYVFDYFVAESERGQTSLLVRAVQEEHWALGLTAAYGYTYLSNRPALWTYRTTGWKELGRLPEQRILSRLALVNGDLYLIEGLSRRRLGHLPLRRLAPVTRPTDR